MAWDSDERDERDAPRRRRRRYEDDNDDDYGMPPGPARSVLVTILAVFNIAIGGLAALASLFFAFIAAVVMMAGNRRDQEESLVVLMVALVVLVVAVVYLIAGIGILGRRNWARVLNLILGAFNFLAVAALIAGFVLVLNNARMRRDDLIGFFILFFFGIIVHLAYGIFIYMTLLRASFAQEFTK